MKRTRIIALIAVLMLVAAACGGESGDTTTTSAESGATTTAAPDAATTTAAPDAATTTAAPDAGGPLSEYGESIDADPALVEKAIGPVTGPVPDIVLASIARADQNLDDATIAIALECWTNAVECDTGTGGDVVMGYADGGGLNVWRQVTRMEAILQALTYPEIGKMLFRDAQWNVDPAVAEADIRFLIQAGSSFIIGYPDQGTNIAGAILEIQEAGIPYIPYSAGAVGLPGEDGALTPGVDYLTLVGEDVCALGESFSEVVNAGVSEGTIGVLGGTPGNALSVGWQQCHIPTLSDTVELVGDPADTYWVNDFALQAVLGWLTTDPDIAAYSYEYADGLNTALGAYDELGIELGELTVAIRTDEQTLFCDWVERDNPDYHIWYSGGGNFQSRTAVTAAMLSLAGADIPAEIVVPHIMREVTAADCDADRVTPTVSGTSLVPSAVLALMYPNG